MCGSQFGSLRLRGVINVGAPERRRDAGLFLSAEKLFHQRGGFGGRQSRGAGLAEQDEEHVRGAEALGILAVKSGAAGRAFERRLPARPVAGKPRIVQVIDDGDDVALRRVRPSSGVAAETFEKNAGGIGPASDGIVVRGDAPEERGREKEFFMSAA